MPRDEKSRAEGDERDAGTSARASRVFVSVAARRDAAVRLAVLVGGVAVLTAGIGLLFPQVTDPAWIRARIEAFGPLAPLAFLVLETVQVIVAPIPGQVLGGVAGYLFGAVYGTVLALAGVLCGSAIAFTAARRYGRPYAERVLDPGSLRRWDGFVDRAGLPGLFVLFVLPAFPDDVLCFVAGLSEIRLRTFLALVLFGRGPSFVAVVYAGTALGEGRLRTTFLLVGLLVVFSVGVVLARDRIVGRLEGITGPD